MEHREFENISTAVLALFPPLPESEQRVALTLYRLLAEVGPVSAGLLARMSGIGAAETERMLSGWASVYRDDDGEIIGYGGLTIAKTKHRMRLGRNTRYTWCAWDTLFIPQLLNTTAQVESICPATGKRVALTVRPDGIEPSGEPPLVSLVAPEAAVAAADIVSHFCCHVHFFATEGAGQGWIAKQPGTFLATLEQAWQLGCRRNAQHYPMMQT
jgi:alkylmercury lyase